MHFTKFLPAVAFASLSLFGQPVSSSPHRPSKVVRRNWKPTITFSVPTHEVHGRRNWKPSVTVATTPSEIRRRNFKPTITAEALPVSEEDSPLDVDSNSDGEHDVPNSSYCDDLSQIKSNKDHDVVYAEFFCKSVSDKKGTLVTGDHCLYAAARDAGDEKKQDMYNKRMCCVDEPKLKEIEQRKQEGDTF